MEKKKQHSWKGVQERERERERERGGWERENLYLHDYYGVVSSSLTSHAIVAEPLTELIPHNEEYREWKCSQLAELLSLSIQ